VKKRELRLVVDVRAVRRSATIVRPARRLSHCATMSALPTAFVSWSSGKDGAFALCEARRCGLARIVGVLTTLNEAYARMAMHGVRAALGVPALKVRLPEPCSNEVYQARMARACERIRGQGVTQVCVDRVRGCQRLRRECSEVAHRARPDPAA
jgi:hypothetical protein